MASSAAGNEGDPMEGVSPTDKTSMAQTISQSLGPMSNGRGPLEARADPDAQTTVTDFLDFTEYLPSDMIRSLTLIGKLDQAYANASNKVDLLTTTWGQLPSIPAEERPSPVQLRADISDHLNQAVSSRVFAHAEAERMSENVHRHYNKAKALLAKLKTMMENYPAEDSKSPAAPKSPQLVRANKLTVRAGGEGGQKVHRQRVPRITVPGEVLAPYDLEYDTFTDESDVSSDEESDAGGMSRTPGPAPRIKIVSSKPLKTPNRPVRPVPFTSAAVSAAAAANAAALLHPPPENAVIGSPDAPWLQLTQYELAKLRKRMKKNATWTPSETMIARELKALNRGPDAYREAKKKAEDEGKSFEPPVPAPVLDEESGTQQLPAGAISVDSLAADEVPTSNRGMKLNEAKKLKREALAKLAAEEAEESARKMTEAAKQLFMGDNGNQKTSNSQKASNTEAPKEAVPKAAKTRTNSRSHAKRKRDPEPDPNTDAPQPADTPSARPPVKRTKTETPVPPPQHLSLGQRKMPTPENSISTPLATPGGTAVVTHSETPVPIPIPIQGSSMASSARAATSPTPSTTNHNTNTVTTSVPLKVPPTETPVPLPNTEQRKSVTPVLPPIRETPVRETTKRETRGEAAKRTQQQQQQQEKQEKQDQLHHQQQQPQKQATPVPLPQPPQVTPAPEPVIKQSSSRAPTPRAPTPRVTPAPPEREALRRPSSRGKAMSQEPQPSLAADRPRRASTARNTPAPETRQPSKRTRRPAPGVVSTTNSGGKSAVGKRKAAPKKRPRARKDKSGIVEEMVDADEEGNDIDPNEPTYCLCNGVSFGTMIQCDNDNCKQEWFHLKCVGLEDVPARTTKWYCPECRVILNIGEKGEVNARGVRA
ncbi:Fc.00g110510.m01.CDS01 [Cosmosporella sp. VM-42]